MKYAIIIMTIFLTVRNVFGALEQEPSTSAARKSDFVYVVALEKGLAQETSENWNPTLYKIDVEKGKIVQTIKLAEQGAPVFCQRLGDNNIRVYIEEGIAANGTFVSKPKTRIMIINKESMHIVKQEVMEGTSDEKWRANIEQADAHLKKTKKIGTYLGAFMKSKLFVLTYRDEKQNRAIKILDSNSYQEIDSIPLNVGNRELGGFFGRYDAAWLKDRLLLCLFYGDGLLGYYAHGYIMILNTVTREIEYIPIGSNPARGIAY